MANINDVATPAAETPLGLFTVLVIGVGVAALAWNARSEIDLFFFRASGGNTRFGKFMAIAFPLSIAGASIGFVAKVLI